MNTHRLCFIFNRSLLITTYMVYFPQMNNSMQLAIIYAKGNQPPIATHKNVALEDSRFSKTMTGYLQNGKLESEQEFEKIVVRDEEKGRMYVLSSVKISYDGTDGKVTIQASGMSVS